MTALAPCRAPGPAGSAGAFGLAAPPRTTARHDRHMDLLGARVRFRSDSEALLALVDAAYAGLPAQRFPQAAPPELDVELHLLPRRADGVREPPPVLARLDGRLPYGVMDACNHVLVSPARRRARVVASEDMLEQHPYHLRYELLEFAVFLLATHARGLVPLHAGCIGRGGRGLLVLGESGAGKSTLALHALLQGLDFLSEDAVFVEADGMQATGVANFLHVQADALGRIADDDARRWIAGSPVIRRRSGARKFEADLRHAPAPARLAPAPLRLVGTLLLSPQPAADPGALLAPAAPAALAACLALDQAHAMAQPTWRRFEQRLLRLPAYRLQRGPHPSSSVDAVRRLLG